MNEQINEARSLTLKGLRTVIIFYLVMFLTSVFLIVGVTYFSTNDISLYPFIGVIVILFSLLMIYFGVQDVYKGKTEFSPEHQKSVLFAKKLIFWGIIIFFACSYLALIFRVSILLGSDFIYAFIQTIGFLPFWLALVYLIKEITPKRIVNLLWFAFVSRIILDFLSRLSNHLFVLGKDVIVEYYFPVNIIALIPSFVFIYCYYFTYNKLKNKETQ